MSEPSGLTWSGMGKGIAGLPGWMKQVPPYKGVLSEDGRSVVLTFRIRRWHPGLWVVLIKHVLRR
jgi:hypothetical protein